MWKWKWNFHLCSCWSACPVCRRCPAQSAPCVCSSWRNWRPCCPQTWLRWLIFFLIFSGTHPSLYVTSCRRYHPLFMSLQDALMKLMEEICDLVPESYKERCDDFVSKYGEQIVEFLLSSAAPHTVCTLLHLCLFEDQTVPGQLDLCNKYIPRSFVSSSWPEPHTSTAPIIPQRCSSPRTASRAARWLCWADFTWVQTLPNLRPPLSSSLCVSITPMPSPRSDPQLTLNTPQYASSWQNLSQITVIWKYKRCKKVTLALFSVWGFHQNIWLPSAEGFGEPDGRCTCLWRKKKLFQTLTCTCTMTNLIRRWKGITLLQVTHTNNALSMPYSAYHILLLQGDLPVNRVGKDTLKMCFNTVTGCPVRKVVSNLIPVSQCKSDIIYHFQLLLYFLNTKHIQIQTISSMRIHMYLVSFRTRLMFCDALV